MLKTLEKNDFVMEDASKQEDRVLQESIYLLGIPIPRESGHCSTDDGGMITLKVNEAIYP